jgi:hypothetical protein
MCWLWHKWVNDHDGDRDLVRSHRQYFRPIMLTPFTALLSSLQIAATNPTITRHHHDYHHHLPPPPLHLALLLFAHIHTHHTTTVTIVTFTNTCHRHHLVEPWGGVKGPQK